MHNVSTQIMKLFPSACGAISRGRLKACRGDAFGMTSKAFKNDIRIICRNFVHSEENVISADTLMFYYLIFF